MFSRHQPGKRLRVEWQNKQPVNCQCQIHYQLNFEVIYLSIYPTFILIHFAISHDMLCSRFKQILFNRPALNNNLQCRSLITTLLIYKQCRIDELLASIFKNKKEVRTMSSVRFILRNLGVNKLRSVWTRSVNVGNVVRRYRRDRTVRDVIVCFRQAFFRPRRTLLFSATAAYTAKSSDDEKPLSCDLNITDEELEVFFSTYLEKSKLKSCLFSH